MSSRPVIVEACVTSPEEASACFAAGATRAELCRALDVGGLTPVRSSVSAALEAATGEVFVLVRPRAGSFRMRPAEVDGLVEEVASMVSLGVDGVVVGVLDGAGRVDRGALSELVNAASGRPVTFHRAFDEVEDPLGEVESLIEAGVKRVLTSGGALTAWEGREVLRKLVELCSNRLTVLGGGGVRGDHVAQLVEMTGLAEVHARASAVAGVVGGLG